MHRTRDFIAVLVPPLAALVPCAAGQPVDEPTIPAPAAAVPSDPLPLTAARPIAPEPHPFTVEPGRFLLELYPIDYFRDRPRGESERTHTVAVPVVLKFGVLDNLDVHFGLDSFVWTRTRGLDTGETDTESGVGDLLLRAKLNLWGNDGGESALAVMPFITLPTARRDLGAGSAQGGVMVPMAYELAENWVLEWTPGLGILAHTDRDRRGHHLAFSSTLVLNYDLSEDLSIFGEFDALARGERGTSWEGALGGGVTWQVNVDTVLEVGALAGITRAADDLNLYLALVRRF